MTHLRFLLAGSSALILSAILWGGYGILQDQSHALPVRVRDCNIALPEKRFSCFINALEQAYKEHRGNLRDFTALIEKDIVLGAEASFAVEGDVSYAIFGTNCHTFYHAVGDFIATHAKEESPASILGYCPSSCTAGCTMGLYKRTALKNNFSTDLLKRFYKVCRKEELHQCAHEIGHLLHDKYVSSILKILDELSYKQYGLKSGFQYKYTTFEKANLDAPFEDCKVLTPENEWPYCFTGIGHNMFLFAEFSSNGYKDVFRECETVAEENRDSCLAFIIYRIGINEAAPKFLSDKSDKGKKVCNDAIALTGRRDLMFHCYLGLGGGIGLFIDSEYASVPITDDNLVAIKRKMLDAVQLCESAPEGFIDYCFKGLMGTRFGKLYKQLNIYLERFERLLPELTDFEVVG